MKKQLLLLAVVGGALAVAAPSAFAQITPQSFNPDAAANATGNTANTINVSGNIPEYIQFTSVDNQLEFGNLGGPLNQGLSSANADENRYVASQNGTPFVGSGLSVYQTGSDPINDSSGNLAVTPNGQAGIQFLSNAYVIIQSHADPMRNVGPDGIRGTSDDVVLITGFATRYRGNAIRIGNPVISDGHSETGLSTFAGYSASPATATSPALGYKSYLNWKKITIDNTLLEQIIFKPGSPLPPSSPYASNGYVIKAQVERHGLNDYRGDYAGKINMTYYKF